MAYQDLSLLGDPRRFGQAMDAGGVPPPPMGMPSNASPMITPQDQMIAAQMGGPVGAMPWNGPPVQPMDDVGAMPWNGPGGPPVGGPPVPMSRPPGLGAPAPMARPAGLGGGGPLGRPPIPMAKPSPGPMMRNMDMSRSPSSPPAGGAPRPGSKPKELLPPPHERTSSGGPGNGSGMAPVPKSKPGEEAVDPNAPTGADKTAAIVGALQSPSVQALLNRGQNQQMMPSGGTVVGGSRGDITQLMQLLMARRGMSGGYGA